MAHPPHFGLRAQLRNYFGKHATFSVQINIHELANVPLVSGDFACKWRVKGAQPLTQVQSLARRDSASTKSVRSDGTGSVSGSGSGSLKDMVSKKLQKARTGDTDIEVQVQPPSPPPSAKTHGSISTTLSLGESGWSSPSESSDSRPGTVSMLLPDSMSSSQGHSSDTEDGQPRQTHSSVTVTDRFHPHLHSVFGPGRGTTATVAIADHTVRWDELVELAVHMGIIKETKGLMPNELKLMVEHVPQLHEQLVKPRTALGVVRINLAEYVGRGPITRRYLLRDSKTNATLKLTIEVKWLSGEQDYIAPPLQKAQIMEGVAGLMSNDRILPPTGVRTPPRPAASTTTSFSSFVNIGTPTPDLLPTPSNLNVNRGRAASLSRSPTLSHSLSFSRPTTPGPTARTEQIIEALFNPVPTTNPNPSPFAYYAPGRPPIRKSTINVSAVPSDLDSSWSIVKAQQDAQARALLQMPLTEEPVSREPSPVHENPGWWKRIGSATLSKGKRPEQPPPTIRLSSAVV